MSNIWISNNTSVSGNISSLNGLQHFSTQTAVTYMEITPEQERLQKKEYIKSIIGDDNYLLQEIISELRRDKIKQLKKNKIK
jgi:hypothetical protein